MHGSTKIEIIAKDSNKLELPHPECKITKIGWWQENLIKGASLHYPGKKALNNLVRTLTKIPNIMSGISGSDLHHEYIIITYEAPDHL